MVRGITIALILALVVLLMPLSAAASAPLLPHGFYGTVQVRSTLDGPDTDAPVGTVIEAVVNGEEKGRIIVTEAGIYGGPGIGDGKLVVQDVAGEGNTIEFYVNGYPADQTWEYHSDEITELNLTAYVPPAPTIGYDPASFSFSATEGGANPGTQPLQIWNSGAMPTTAMAWSLTDNADWLSLNPTSGSSSGEHDTVTVSVDISGMTAGDYDATITITADGATNTPQRVPVILTIGPRPTPSPSPTTSPGGPVGPGGPGVTPTPVVTPTPPGPAVVTSIEVTPEEASIEVGETRPFTATATYSDGITEDVTAEADWASSNTAVATVDAGLATGVGAGTIEITATFEGISDRAMLNVSVVLESIAVIPESASLDVGDTQQFTAIATYSDGSTRDVTAEADWASSNTAVATIDDAGLATGVAGGSTEITATFGGMTGAPASILTITAAPPAIPWWIIGLIIGLLLLLALLLLLRRRMRRGEEAAA